jgi:hypothetical protein
VFSIDGGSAECPGESPFQALLTTEKKSANSHLIKSTF